MLSILALRNLPLLGTSRFPVTAAHHRAFQFYIFAFQIVPAGSIENAGTSSENLELVPSYRRTPLSNKITKMRSPVSLLVTVLLAITAATTGVSAIPIMDTSVSSEPRV